MSPTPDQRLLALATCQHGVVTTAQAVRLGLSQNQLSARVRSGQYRSLWRGVMWVRPDGPDVPWLTRVHGALLLCGPHAAAALGTAADLQRIAGHDTGWSEVQVLLPRLAKRRSPPGIALHFWDVPPDSTLVVDRIRCSNAVRTIADLVPRLARNQAVACLDSALNRRLISASDLVSAQQIARGRPGAARASLWWTLPDARADSPLETWARLDCMDAGLSPDELQWPVLTAAGEVIGYGDLAWLGRRRPLVAEADGDGSAQYA